MRWLPYFLNPDTPPKANPTDLSWNANSAARRPSRRCGSGCGEAGAGAGIAFAFERIEKRANTLAAHRLIHRFQAEGWATSRPWSRASSPPSSNRVATWATRRFLPRSRLRPATTTPGRQVFSPASAMPKRFWRCRPGPGHGHRGVPFFIFAGRLGVSGAHPPETLIEGDESGC